MTAAMQTYDGWEDMQTDNLTSLQWSWGRITVCNGLLTQVGLMGALQFRLNQVSGCMYAVPMTSRGVSNEGILECPEELR